jgi:hypothetical protein
MKDRIYLQQLWSFLSKQMSTIASKIKCEAERKFERDMQEKGLANHNTHLLAAAVATTTTTTSASTSTTSQDELFFSPTNTSTRDNMQEAKKRDEDGRGGCLKQARSLIELCDDEQIFAKLHMWFTWMLRMSSRHITEVFVNGPVSEDCQVTFERQSELVEFSLNDDANDAGDNDEYDEDNEIMRLMGDKDEGETHEVILGDRDLNVVVVENLRQLIKVEYIIDKYKYFKNILLEIAD